MFKSFFGIFSTLTPPVKLMACLKAIKYAAFAASSYTTVITLEDHLSSDLQAKAAKVSQIPPFSFDIRLENLIELSVLCR